MTVGIDPSGRAFRWKVDNFGEVGVDYLVMGCPPMPGDNDEITLWNDQYSFRPQIYGPENKYDLPAKLVSIGMNWNVLSGTKSEEFARAGKEIVEALKTEKRCPPKATATTAFAIPNHLSEDAQDALLTALRAAGYSTPVLLWRPIAIMLHWLYLQHAYRQNAYVWVLDFDAPYLELTRLSWRLHDKDPHWIAPVRSYPVRRPLTHRTLTEAMNEIFQDVPETERIQFRLGQTAPEVQKQLESRTASFGAWVCTANRWRKTVITLPKLLTSTFEKLKQEIRNVPAAMHYPAPLPEDIILVHGWLPRLYPEAIKRTLQDLWPVNDVQVMSADCIAQGAQIFADRYAKNLPTYYDQLPEYRIWTNAGWKVLVAEHQEVEPGKPWRLEDRTLQNAFKISRYRSDLSFLVQRNPITERTTDFARRLKVGLKQMTNSEFPLQLDAEVKPAQGSALFKVTAVNGEKPFVHDEQNFTNTSSLSYGISHEDKADQGRTTKEPEHKGYLEAQPVIGRIYDNPEQNIEMLRLIVDHCNDLEMGNTFTAVVTAIQNFRIDNPTPDNFTNMQKCILAALARWGFEIRQPTRGLFGTKLIENRQISELYVLLATHLWDGCPAPANNGPRNFWSKRQNYCHIFASEAYKMFIRDVLKDPTKKFPSWSEVYAPGYVLGEDPDDARLLANYCVARQFDITDKDYPEKHFWSFFRMLCWHPEVHLETDFIKPYLSAVVGFVSNTPVLSLQLRKYICFALLYALRIRERAGFEDFLLTDPDAELKNQLVAFLAVGGRLGGVSFPPTMIPNLNGVTGNLSDYVSRFLLRQDTVEDRELGSSIATAD
jgi:hypothetical protein